MLEATEFKFEHAGQLDFSPSAIDAQTKAVDERRTIGVLLCRSQNRLVAEYQLVRSLPAPLDTNLPSIDEIEAELSRDLANVDGRDMPGNRAT